MSEEEKKSGKEQENTSEVSKKSEVNTGEKVCGSGSCECVGMDDVVSGKAETLFTETVDDDVDELDIIARGKFFAAISYVWVLCFVPIFFKRKNRFAVFHAKQSLLLFIWYIAASTFKCIASRIWLLGKVLGPIACCVKGISLIFIFLFSFVGMYQAITGSYWRLPMMLGDWAEELEIEN